MKVTSISELCDRYKGPDGWNFSGVFNAVRTLADGDYSQVEVRGTDYGNDLRSRYKPLVEWAGYIHGVGWTRHHQSPEEMLYCLREMWFNAQEDAEPEDAEPLEPPPDTFGAVGNPNQITEGTEE